MGTQEDVVSGAVAEAVEVVAVVAAVAEMMAKGKAKETWNICCNFFLKSNGDYFIYF